MALTSSGERHTRMAKLFTILEESDRILKIRKDTQELRIAVELATQFRSLKVATTIDFFDHIIETLSWGACLSIGCEVETGKWRSTHTIAEDVGITIGTGLKRIFTRKLKEEGINITGSCVFGLDEALARAMVSMEGRRNTFFYTAPECTAIQLELVEDMKTQDLFAFVEGFFQGFPATAHVDFLKGRDPHHTWECAVHAIGESLRQAYATNPWRIAANNPYYADEGIADAALE
jgi:imidazoleglycerol-phosphate dehydratase